MTAFGDVTPRFTMHEAELLLLAARTFQVQSEDLLKDEAQEALNGAIRALVMGNSCPDPMVLLQVGSIPPWMEQCSNSTCDCPEANGRNSECFVCDVEHYRMSPTTGETEQK